MSNPNIYDQIHEDNDININKTLQLELMNNQNSNYEILALSTILKSNSLFVICPYCHNICPTRVEKKLNTKNVFFCLLSPYIWGIHQILRNKDINCYDTKHYCLKCNMSLGSYESC